MAQKRMLNKSISLSGQVNKLSTKHKLMFTWSIAHLDDYGRITNDPEVFKGTVHPMDKSITIKDCADFMEAAIAQNLVTNLSDCLEYTGFDNHQTISEEKRAKSRFNGLPQESPRIPENSQESPVQEKRREEKGSKEKRREGNSPASQNYLSQIPEEDLKEFTTRFVASEKEVKSKAEDLKLYCERKNKRYSNYKSFLVNALKKDFKERDGTVEGGKYKGL